MDILSPALADSLYRAHLRQMRRTSRLRVEAGSRSWPVLRVWEGGFSIRGEEAHGLRGLVDLWDGPRHLRHCLVIATATEAGEVECEIKDSAPADLPPAVDYVREERAASALLPHLR